MLYIINKFTFLILISIFVIGITFAEKKDINLGDASKPPVLPKKYSQLAQLKEWRIDQLRMPWIQQDNNNDGLNDSALIISETNYNKRQEILDLNFDGFADDFAYFNEAGKIEFQEIDSNFDKKIDIWVEIFNGIKVISIQQDIDFDGYVDIAKFY